MLENALISYLGENKPNLISEITAYLTDAGGEFSGVTFATLGRVCELTMIYKTDGKKTLEDLQNDLQKLSSVGDGQLQIKSLPNQSDTGPTSKITHRIVLSGDDEKGLLNKIIKTLDDNNALIVRMKLKKYLFLTTLNTSRDLQSLLGKKTRQNVFPKLLRLQEK